MKRRNTDQTIFTWYFKYLVISFALLIIIFYIFQFFSLFAQPLHKARMHFTVLCTYLTTHGDPQVLYSD